MSSEHKDDAYADIDAFPEITREELIDVVFKEGDNAAGVSDNRYTAPRAEEWVDLLDAGPYVDEMDVPLFSPNGDGSGGEETFDSPAANAWLRKRLERYERVGQVTVEGEASGGQADTEQPLAARASSRLAIFASRLRGLWAQ